MKLHTSLALTLACSLALAGAASAQTTGPSTLSTPYLQPTQSYVSTTSILTVDNDNTTTDDSVPRIGGGPAYGLDGIPDGLGAFDNGNGTFTLLVNHEFGSTQGIVRDHGSKGSYVSEFIIRKSDFTVLSGGDLMKNVYSWNTALQQSNTTTSTFAFNRFCSADLAPVSAFSFGGLGSTERIFLHGEEGGATGYQQATIATGASKGDSFTLGKFNLTTNGSGLTGVGAWENSVASPFAQTKTIVASGNDGGSGIMTNSVSVYVGTKQSTGTEVEKAGLNNGTLKFVNVAGVAQEITAANATSRATAITSGTAFTLSSTASTTFSRPEDIAWNTVAGKQNQLYFVTTDRLDQVSDGIGSQIGTTRLWRLNFSDLTNPDLGGTIDLLVDSDIVDGKKVNMFDNIAVGVDGLVYLQEDVGGAAHNGKVFVYNPATDSLTTLLRHDTARFGDIGISATAPFTNDEEGSGIIDISAIMGVDGITEKWLLSSDQAHYPAGGTLVDDPISGITASNVEGGQLFAIHIVPEPSAAISLIGGVGMLLGLRRRRA